MVIDTIQCITRGYRLIASCKAFLGVSDNQDCSHSYILTQGSNILSNEVKINCVW